MSETNCPDPSYGLVLSFFGLYENFPEECAFVHGVELGALWERMQAGHVAEFESTTHERNRGIIQRAAEASGWEADIKPSGADGWDFTKLRKVRAATTLNPHGLRVVK